MVGRPPFFYRYMSMNNDTRREYVRQIIQDNCLYFASLAQVNDPIDCKPLISLHGGTIQQIREFLSHSVRKQYPTWTDDAVYREVDIIREKHTESSLDQEISRQWGKYIEDEAFICCMSSKGDDPDLFGSEYGNNHDGVCLEFIGDDELLMPKIRRVQYTEDRVTFHYFKDVNPIKTQKMFFMKKKKGIDVNGHLRNWEEEAEWRMVHKIQGTQGFAPQLLKRIILGSRLNEANRALISHWTKNRKTPLEITSSVLKVRGK